MIIAPKPGEKYEDWLARAGEGLAWQYDDFMKNKKFMILSEEIGEEKAYAKIYGGVALTPEQQADMDKLAKDIDEDIKARNDRKNGK